MSNLLTSSMFSLVLYKHILFTHLPRSPCYKYTYIPTILSLHIYSLFVIKLIAFTLQLWSSKKQIISLFLLLPSPQQGMKYHLSLSHIKIGGKTYFLYIYHGWKHFPPFVFYTNMGENVRKNVSKNLHEG